MKKILLIVTGMFLFVAIGGTIFFKTSFPKVSAPSQIKVDVTPEKVARGKYLAHNVALCMDCHSTRDWTKYAGPPVAGTEGSGGERFGEEFGFPGTYYARNITPAGIGDWTDGELIRAITCGINKKGEALFEIMPYKYYRTMSEDDVHAIVAYLHTVAPVKRELPERSIPFPFSMIINTIPEDAALSPAPASSDTVAYGKYLTNVAGCGECHTPITKGNGPPQKIKGMEYAGGFEFPVSWGLVRSPNITPDTETGIGKWTREQFIGKFKSYAGEDKKKIEMKPPYTKAYHQSLMPWTMYAGMTESDLASMYAYLRTLQPVHNQIEKYSETGATFSMNAK
jgi:mono/diheme cytochrome c family protein